MKQTSALPKPLSAIRNELQAVKPVSEKTLRRYLKKLKIKPLGARQCPQLYPADTAKRVLKNLTTGRAK